MTGDAEQTETTQEVVLEKHDGWAELILNRPKTRNAINGPFGELLAQHATELNKDASIGAVLLRGAGGAFCSGLDLKSFNADPKPAWHGRFQTIWRDAHRSLFNLNAALVVGVERYAINGGAALALAGDFLLLGDDAFLHVGEVQQGMGAPYNLAWLRLRHSESVTARVALLGDRIGAQEAVTLGLATKSVAADQLVNEAQEFTAKLGGYPSGAMAHVKAISTRYREPDPDAWFDRAFSAGPAPSSAPRAND